MISVPNPVSRMVHGDQLNRVVMIISSPIRLGRGGSARFARLAMNHQTAVSGKITCNPRARIIVRLWVRSYAVLARQNSAEDTNPWAIIRMIAPENPQGVWIRIPPATRPI